MPNLEEVFRLSGVPTYTFVEPDRYAAIKVAIRTPGRCVVMEGPSGIGKTTTATKIITELGRSEETLLLSARRPADVEIIEQLPAMGKIGTVIVDDFHRLSEEVKRSLSDYMKVLADEGDDASQLVLIGINKAGDQLVRFAHDLGMRIDVFKLEANPTYKIEELITKGEIALNIEIADKDKIAERSQGSFQIAQVLCHAICIENNITEDQADTVQISTSVEVIIERVMADFARQYMEPAITFARGSKIRREGRAPYLHILKWLSQSDDWSLDLTEMLRQFPEHKGSVGQVLEKGFLAALMKDKADKLDFHFHYEPSTRVLSVEDPKLIFFLKNTVWRAFTRRAGFTTEYFKGQYDFALSFAGADRAVAKRLAEILEEHEISVFYDENEQHRILAQNVEDYLAPIYRSEAQYVVPLMSPAYPGRLWTKFESDNFRERFGENAVIPIRFTTVVEGFFSDERKYGGMIYNPAGDVEGQLHDIAATLARRLVADREAGDQEAEAGIEE